MRNCVRIRLCRALVGLSFLGCSVAGPDGSESIRYRAQAAHEISVDTRRSLVVTEQTILERFSLERVLNQLVDQSGVPGLTATDLFRQWWDTQNPGPGLGLGPHCDDIEVDGVSAINGYPYLCRQRPAEGAQADCDPFAAGSDCAYIPLALFNRFDLAPEDGSHCGEHRIVFAKTTGIEDSKDRVLLIFEAGMPNPHVQQGLKGCRKIVDAWADLTNEDDIEARADALERLYFDGQGNVPPVIDVAHYGDNPTGLGQVRTNQLSNTTTGWSLREFKLLATCGAGNCSALEFVPVTDKTNAFGPLFDPSSSLPRAADFRAYFPSQVASLASMDLGSITMAVPDAFNSAQSQASGDFADEIRYALQLGADPSPLRSAIQAELTALGSDLTPDDIALRAQAQSCAGCHRLNNEVDLGGGLTWPASTGFTHVTERETEVVDGETRYLISPALVDVFLPLRKGVLEDYLNNKPRPPRAPGTPIGGRFTDG